jgi:hypothetical protein
MTFGPSSPLLCFRPTSGGVAVCIGRSRKAIVLVVADDRHGGMYRLRRPDGRLSDMANLARIKDAVLSHAAAVLNAKQDRGVSPSEAPPVARTESAATPVAGRVA